MASSCCRAWFAISSVLVACSQSPPGDENVGTDTVDATTSSTQTETYVAPGDTGTGSTTGMPTTEAPESSGSSEDGTEAALSSSSTSSQEETAMAELGDSDAGGSDLESSGEETPEGALTLLYLDVVGDRVLMVPAAGGEPDVLVEGAGQGPDGIAVDPRTQRIYWTNMGNPAEEDGFILRSESDGADVTTIVMPGETYTPKQLKLDLQTDKLYWGDREGMRVMRCNLDGSAIETLVTVAEGDAARQDLANHVVGVAVDPVGGYFYWIQKGPPNGGEGSIRRAHLDMPDGENDRNRSDIEVLFGSLPEPIDLEVDGEGGVMYWTDRGDATINRAPIEVPEGSAPSTREDREVLVEGVDVAIGVWLDRDAGHVYYTGTDVVGRVDLDGSGNTTLVEDAGVLTGITGIRLP